MPEAFSGSVSQFKVIDIVRLLASEGKTGVLSIQRGKEKGELYVNKGALVHAICKDGVGEEAVFAILTWADGNFNFTPNATSEEKTIEKNTLSLLEEKIKQLEEWQQIKEIISSQDIVFKLSSKRAPDEVRLKHDSWSVLSQIDGKKTVGNISDELKMGEYDTARNLYKLFSSGLIEVATAPQRKAKKVVDGGFFDLVEKELAEIIGPVAPVILDEEIKDMGEERNSFPVDKVSLLVEKVSGEIADDTQRIAFQKTTLSALRG
ncbi:MAG: hypothetical protein A2Z08_12145 [Deltaproteobacteria bacterium RBG_16_54_11]|jgi:hypothetical protein|nr:MAG: hypothetical protein A2Z08_12145 [Deltaproteobacteria bacterium RBG_16_54_11]